jgi:hypothetical protein
MQRSRLTMFDRVVIGMCLLWLTAWTLMGIVLAWDVYTLTLERWSAVQKAATIFSTFTGIGCIALVDLWPHRWLLRRSKQQSSGHGFEVK